MRVSKLGLVVFPWLLSAAPTSAQPPDDYGGESYAEMAPGASVDSVDVFYDQLSQYGFWVEDPMLGRVFIPDVPDYVPYTQGYWQYTNLGFVWVSDEPFGWATSHYGRWAFSNVYNRWAWLPDTTWGPAWVEWRQYGDDFGWAPLPPEVVINSGYEVPIFSWRFASGQHLFDRDLRRYYVPRDRIVEIQRESRPLETYRNVGRQRVVVGPSATVLRERNITVKPAQVDVHKIGRMTPTEVTAARTRAEQRKPMIEQQNRKRVESNAQVREAQHKAATMPKNPRVEQRPAQPQPPARVEPKPGERRVEPPKTGPQTTPPARVEPKRETPAQPAPKREAPPARVEPPKAPPAVEPKREAPARVEPKPEPKQAPAPRSEPPARAEPRPEPPKHEAPPQHQAPPAKSEPPKKDDKRDK
jgi:hypothetical protein